MIIEHQGQALTVAMEMERRAIRTYERALLLAKDEEVRKGIEDILGDERRHLKRFTEMWDKTVNSAEQQVLLQAMAADVLFRGGVTEMAREDALTTLTGLYRYAMESEAKNSSTAELRKAMRNTSMVRSRKSSLVRAMATPSASVR